MELIDNMKEKFSNLSSIGKMVVLVLVFAVLGGACYGGYNYKVHGSVMGKVEDADAEADGSDDAANAVKQASKSSKKANPGTRQSTKSH